MIFRLGSNSANIFISAFIGFVLVVLFAFNHLIIPSDKVNPLNSYHRQWIESGIENYRYTLMFGCMRDLEYRVVVKNGVQITPRSIDVYSIDDLFEYADRAEKNADEYNVTYHKTGFPSEIEVNWSKEIWDDECFIEVTDFQVIKPHEL
ncbi:DUF6174 domain-containing protein, partial [Aliiglaciecola sp. NS0011-25]|uniref:DUF6174 domain-containing protein n=1 Tax=Aliiglaciecola sp. NS0011-25 TaxID=3127654 RepID=UPI00333E5C6B